MKIDIELLYKKVEGTLSAAQERELDAWLASSAAHAAYFEKFRAACRSSEACIPDGDRTIRNRSLLKEGMRRSDMVRRKRRRLRLAAASAAAVLLVAAGTYLIGYRSQVADTGALYGEAAEISRSKTSNGKVELVTASGISYDLLGMQKDESGEQEFDLILSEAGVQLVYDQDEPAGRDSEGMSRVIVGRGAEMQVQLKDGTKVWLNSDSELHYPDNFAAGERRVYVKGEAYFEVAKDTRRPFIVSTDVSDIKVYGTQFNVNTRKEDIVVTTLVDGSVSVRLAGVDKEIVLVPGQIAEADRKKERITVKRDDPNLYVGWKRGTYMFKERRIEEVLDEFALWHDLDVMFEDDALRDEIFSGSVQRNASLGVLLNVLERTGYVSFRLEGNVLTVAGPGRRDR